MPVQTRRLGAGNGCVGNAVVGAGFVLVASGGRTLHIALPDDGRTCAFIQHSRSSRRWLLLPNLCCQTGARANGAGSRCRWLCGSNAHCLGVGCPNRTGKSLTARSACSGVVSLPPVRFLHFPDLVCPFLLIPFRRDCLRFRTRIFSVV